MSMVSQSEETVNLIAAKLGQVSLHRETHAGIMRSPQYGEQRIAYPSARRASCCLSRAHGARHLYAVQFQGSS
jgi:hypothetical protein